MIKLPAVLFGLCSFTLAAQTRVQVNANTNQFPYITVRVRAYDAKTGAGVASLTKDKFLISEDLSAVAIEDFKPLSGSRARNLDVDVMFVFDQTGSMSEEIAGLQQRARNFADTIARGGINYRLGLLSFSDSIEKKYDYSADVEQFKRNISALTASGGDDEPENQLDALVEAAEMPSRAGARRIFILVTDASYHFQDRITKRRPEDVINLLKARGIQLHVVGPELDSYKNMSLELAGNFYDKDSDDFAGIVKTLGGEISANYELSYRSPRMQRDGTRRSVRVAVQGDSGTDATQYVAPWFVTASSRREAGRGDESPYAPQKVLDGDAATAWLPSEVGLSNHEWLHLSLPAPRTIAKVTVAAPPGHAFTDQSDVILTLDGGSELHGSRSKDGGLLTFEIAKPAPIRAMHFDLQVKSAASTGISDINAYFPDGGLIPEIGAHHVSTTQKESAREINARGEKAYHAGKIDESVTLYRSAISADPEFAQAFSNLGLSYWKLKKYPESVTANRAAIALGKQQGNMTVMASSYYNIAKTFEEQKEYKQALMNFWWAQKTAPKPAYESAIRRMNAILAREAE
jgi:tetratricopeptide (TPR) repeat protein